MIPADQYINTGRTLFNQCKYDESFKAFDMATQLYQKNADAWCWRGWALFKRNKLDDKSKAFDAFDNATRLDPEYADAWCGKGMALSKQNMLEDSNKAFEEAIKLNPNIVRKYDNEGWNLIIEAMKGAKGDEIHCRYDGSFITLKMLYRLDPLIRISSEILTMQMHMLGKAGLYSSRTTSKIRIWLLKRLKN
ncbi:MAG: tetratricopeptide repeat protein [Methanotrichaceae archaeon]